MSYRCAELANPPLSILNFLIEQIVVMAVKRLSLKVLVVAVAKCNGRTRQHVFNTTAQS